jgi:hypothetical protein
MTSYICNNFYYPKIQKPVPRTHDYILIRMNSYNLIKKRIEKVYSVKQFRVKKKTQILNNTANYSYIKPIETLGEPIKLSKKLISKYKNQETYIDIKDIPIYSDQEKQCQSSNQNVSSKRYRSCKNSVSGW